MDMPLLLLLGSRTYCCLQRWVSAAGLARRIAMVEMAQLVSLPQHVFGSPPTGRCLRSAPGWRAQADHPQQLPALRSKSGNPPG